jgi:S1-C subfamily serine protease
MILTMIDKRAKLIASGLAGAGAAAAVVLIAGAIGAFGSGTTTRTVTVGSSPGSASPIAQTTGALTAEQVYSRSAPSVVSISASSGGSLQGGSSGQQGTGFVISADGEILTNYHVIENAESNITVDFNAAGGATRTATVIGEDPSKDLALLKINPSGLQLKPLTLADSSTAQIGDAVFAIGNPYGLSETLTRGIISAEGRSIQSPNGSKIKGALQTDAALNPGNSGGPLLNGDGQVIGVDAQIATGGGSNSDTGVGFAISSETVKADLSYLRSGGAQRSSSQSSSRSNSQSLLQQQLQQQYGNGYGAAPYGGGLGLGG